MIVVLVIVALSTFLRFPGHQTETQAASHQASSQFLTGANTMETAADNTCTSGAIDAHIGYLNTNNNGMAVAREWVYWPRIETSPGVYTWASGEGQQYDCTFTKFKAAGIKALAVVTRTPYWAALFRDVMPPPKDQSNASWLPPLRRVVKEQITVVKGTSVNLTQPAPVDYYAIASKNPSLEVLSPWQYYRDPSTGHYFVDYETGKITFSPSMLGRTVYMTYIDGFFQNTGPIGKRFANVPVTVTSAMITSSVPAGGYNPSNYSWLTLASTASHPSSGARLLGGTMHVTGEPILVESDALTNATTADFSIDYKIDGRINFPNQANNLNNGDTVYVTYDVLDAGPGSRYYELLTQFASRNVNRVDAISIGNETGGTGVHFWGTRKNPEIYAQMLHWGSQAIRAADPGRTIKITDGWDFHSGNTEFFDVMQARGWWGDIDALSYHHYPVYPDYPNLPAEASYWNDLITNMQRLKSNMDSVGLNKPVYMTEIGWNTNSGGTAPGNISEDRQAQYALRVLGILNWAKGSLGVPMDRLYWFALIGHCPVSQGLFGKDCNPESPKDSYNTLIAYNYFKNNLGFAYYQDMAIGPPVGGATPIGIEYRNSSGDRLLLMWSILNDSNYSATIPLPSPVPVGTVLSNKLAQAQTLNVVGGNAQINLTSSPVYLFIPNSISRVPFSGFAWSENAGWISFNSSDCDPNGNGIFQGVGEGAPAGCPTSGTAVDYRVNIDANNYLSGEAWSENIGWISFNIPRANTPSGEYNYSASGFIARYDTVANELRGWARAYVACAKGNTISCDPTGEAEGGWDGWIKLTKHPSDGGPDYRVTFNASTKEFEGWAWGGEVVGWLSFNCMSDHDPVAAGIQNCLSLGGQDYAVRANIDVPPSIPTLEAVAHSSATYCASPQQKFTWSFSDAEDGSTQTAYQLQADNNSDFSSPTFDSGKVVTGTKERFVAVSVSPGANQLGFNTTYYWRMQVYDSSDNSSGWVNGTSFATPIHPYPQPNFTWAPTGPSIGETVIFTDTTVFHNDGAGGLPDSAIPTWAWTMPGTVGVDYDYVDLTSSTSQNPHVKFKTASSKNVTLLAGDNVGSCSVTKAVKARPPLPQIIEF